MKRYRAIYQIDNRNKEAIIVSYSNSVVKLINLNFKKNKYCNINNLFFKQINLPRNLNRIPIIYAIGHRRDVYEIVTQLVTEH